MIIAVNFPIFKAIGKKKPEKNQGFNGIRTRDLRVTGALLYQLSYEATHWERGQFIEFISPVRSEMMWLLNFRIRMFVKSAVIKRALYLATKRNSRDIQKCNNIVLGYPPMIRLFASARRVFPAATATGVHRLRNT